MLANIHAEVARDTARFYEIELAIEPDHEDYYEAGVYWLKSGDPERCIGLLDRVKNVKPEAHYYLGIAFYRLGEYDMSAVNFEKFIARRGDVWQPYYYLSLIYLKQNRVEDALQLLHMPPGDPDKEILMRSIQDYELLDKARVNLREGKYEEALELYEQVDDYFDYRRMGLALTYAKLGKYQQSLALLDSVIEYTTDEDLAVKAMFESSRQLVQLRNTEKAKRYLRKYLAIVADDDANFLMGRIFNEESKFDSARVYLQDLPDSIDAFLFYKGRTEYYLGIWGRAEARLLLHRERFPESFFADRALYILASINFKRAEYREAISFWREMVDQFPNSIYAASAMERIGDSYSRLCDYGSALNAYYQVTQYDPAEKIASEVLLKVYEIKYYLHKYPSLIDALRRYLRDNPGSKLVARTKFRIAKTLYETGRYYQSMNELDRIVKEYPKTAEAIEALLLRVQVSQAVESKFELLHSLRSLLMSENAAEYRLYAASELGALWISEARYDSALYYYNLLLDSPTYRESAIMRIADIYGRLGQTKESITMIELLVSEYPQSTYLTDAYLLYSAALRSQGDYEAAIALLSKAMIEFGDRPDLHMELGDLYFETEEFANARDHFLIACDMFKQKREDAARALVLAGDASLRISDKPKAKAYYLQASMIAESTALKNQAVQKLTTLDDQ
jgi:tetratricopeptide (TPR) repeat protein